MKVRHIVIIVLFLLINVLILFTLTRGRGEDKEEDKTVEFVQTLEAVRVLNYEEQFEVSGFGTVSSYNAVDVSCEVQGKLEANIQLKPGVRFKKGQLLFKVNDREARYSIRARKSSFINLLANILPDIRVDFPSEYDKWNDYINGIKLNESLPTLPSWKSDKEKVFLSSRNILSEYFSIKSQEEQLMKFSVYAPFSGVITEVFTPDFSVVNPGAKIIRIVETGNNEVAVPIPSAQISKVEIGTDCEIFSTDGTRKGTGKVVRISEVINRNTQSVDVFVKPVALDGMKFLEGEYVEVRISKSGEFSGIRIPESAVSDQKVFIYSKADSTLSRQDVQVMNRNEKGVFVSGLKDNQIVITQEVRGVTDSTRYKVLIGD